MFILIYYSKLEDTSMQISEAKSHDLIIIGAGLNAAPEAHVFNENIDIAITLKDYPARSHSKVG